MRRRVVLVLLVCLAVLAGACGPAGGPDPAKLTLLGSVGASAGTPGIFGVTLSGGHAYVNTTYGAAVIALNRGSDATVVAELESSPKVFDRALPTALAKGHFFSAHSSRVDIIDVTTPASPRAVGRVTTTGRVVDLEVVGSTLYVADETLGVAAYDLSNPAAPALLAQVSTGGTNAFAANERHVFVALKAGFLETYAVSGASYTKVGSVQFAPGDTVDLDLAGTRLFASGSVYLGLLDVSRPEAPTHVVTAGGPGIVSPGSGQGGSPAGSHYYAARTSGHAEVFDLSNPAEWKRVASLSHAAPHATAYDVAVTATQAALAHDDGLLIFGAP